MSRVKDDKLFNLLRSEFDRGFEAGWKKGFVSREWECGRNIIDHTYGVGWKGRVDPTGYVAFRLGYLVGCAQRSIHSYSDNDDQFSSFMRPVATAAQESLLTALTFLVGSTDEARRVYDDLRRYRYDWQDYSDFLVSAYLTEFATDLRAKHRISVPNPRRVGYRVFIIHGRDTGARDEIANAVTKGGFQPIVLDAAMNKGRTIIEKLEDESACFYAVGLLTPDDLGGLAEEKTKNPRARQNVVFELGWFMATLGRHRVCCVLKGKMELPSDLHGIAYYRFDQHAQEIAPQVLDEIRWWL